MLIEAESDSIRRLVRQAVHGRRMKVEPDFTARKYVRSPFTITKQPLTEETLDRGTVALNELVGLENQANKLVYSFALPKLETDPDLTDRVYYGEFEQNELTGRQYDHRLQNRIDNLKKYSDLGFHPILLIYIESINEYVPKRLQIPTDPEKFKTRMRRGGLPLVNEEIDFDKTGRWYFSRPQTAKRFAKYRQKKLAEARSLVDRRESVESLLSEWHTFLLDTDSKLNLKLSLDAPSEYRQEISNSLRWTIQDKQNLTSGLENLASGGLQVVADLPPESTLHNHNRFPNLEYPSEIREQCSTLAQALRNQLDTLPDFSDLAAPRRLRSKTTLQYDFSELPKNPLDVTFGNDAGCCIFVPERLEEMDRGWSIPVYLINPYIRLFGQFRRGEKDHRMGVVVAFETTDMAEKTKYLSCNSLELSRNGLAGGEAALRRLVEYDHNWLIGYAKKYHYDGVTMGSHSYNTSVNYSSEPRIPVEVPLRFRGDSGNWFSEIFMRDSSGIPILRPAGSHWLWQRDKKVRPQ